MVLSKSPDYQFVNVNDAWLDLFGFAREEVIGKTSSALKVNPDEKARAQIANTLQKNKTVRNVELVLYTKNGDRLVTLLNIDLLRIGDEDYVLNALQNITQQKILENTLRHSEELFKAVTTHSPDHIIIQDQNLVYEYVLNPQLGLTVQEMVGKSDLELLPEHEATELIAIKSRVMRDKQPYMVNIPLTNLSGQTDYFEGTYVPRFDQNGEVDGLFGYFRNVTKQTKVEQELKRSIDDLNIMYQISKELSQLYPLEILNNKIIELLDQYSYYEYAAILLIDHETKKLLPFAVSDKSKGPEYTVQELENIRKLELNIHKGITGWVVRNNKSYRCGNVQTEPQYIEIHPEINSEICVPLQIGQKVMGALLIETERMNAYHEEDQSLLESIAAHVSIAIENARLLEELKQTSENLEKKVAQRTAQLKETLIQKSTDEERQRLARELHDTVSQSMFSISLISESLPRLLSLNSHLFLEGLDDLTRLSRGALAEMRSLLFELRPAAIQNIRLNELLHLMLNGLMSQTRLKVVLNLAGNHVIPENVRYVLFRITKEALNNIIKHANASTVTVNRQDILPISGKRGVEKLSGLKLSIKDDGIGFNPKVIPGGLHGLAIMKERAKSIGATLSIRSKPEKGTEIIIFWRGEFLKELSE
jgi:PAS domain S-box-containing protein